MQSAACDILVIGYLALTQLRCVLTQTLHLKWAWSSLARILPWCGQCTSSRLDIRTRWRLSEGKAGSWPPTLAPADQTQRSPPGGHGEYSAAHNNKYRLVL